MPRFEAGAAKKHEAPKDEEIELTEADAEQIEDLTDQVEAEEVKPERKLKSVPPPPPESRKAKRAKAEAKAEKVPGNDLAPVSGEIGGEKMTDVEQKYREKITLRKAELAERLKGREGTPLGERIKQSLGAEIAKLEKDLHGYLGGRKVNKELRSKLKALKEEKERFALETHEPGAVEADLAELREIEKQRVEDEKPEWQKSLKEARSPQSEPVEEAAPAAEPKKAEARPAAREDVIDVVAAVREMDEAESGRIDVAGMVTEMRANEDKSLADMKSQLLNLEETIDRLDAAHAKTSRWNIFARMGISADIRRVQKGIEKLKDEIAGQEAQIAVSRGEVKKLSPEERKKYEAGKLARTMARRMGSSSSGGSGKGGIGSLRG